MKCPKCGYISFDYNQVCPKCNKDITAEQDKLHIPAFRPDPPALLGALVGESNETHIGLHGDSSAEMRFSSRENLQFDDSAAIERGDIDFGDSQELSVGTEPEMPAAPEGLGDFELGSEGGISDFELEGGECEEISLGPEQAGLDEVETPFPESFSEDLGEDISFDFEGVPGRTPEPGADSTLEQDLGIDLDTLSLGDEETEKAQGEGEIELDLDDFDNDETTDLELLGEKPSGKDLEDTSGMEDLSLDEIQLEESVAEGLGDEDLLAGSEADAGDDEISIDLEDLDLDLDFDDSKPK